MPLADDSLRPSADWPDRAIVAVNLARVAAVIDRIAADVDELARARRAQELTTAAVHPPAAARFLNPATGAGLGRLAGRAIPARRDQPAGCIHR